MQSHAQCPNLKKENSKKKSGKVSESRGSDESEHLRVASPAFTIAKLDGSLRSLTDNRAINEHIKRHPKDPSHVAETGRFHVGNLLGLEHGTLSHEIVT